MDNREFQKLEQFFDTTNLIIIIDPSQSMRPFKEQVEKILNGVHSRHIACVHLIQPGEYCAFHTQVSFMYDTKNLSHMLYWTTSTLCFDYVHHLLEDKFYGKMKMNPKILFLGNNASYQKFYGGITPCAYSDEFYLAERRLNICFDFDNEYSVNDFSLPKHISMRIADMVSPKAISEFLADDVTAPEPVITTKVRTRLLRFD